MDDSEASSVPISKGMGDSEASSVPSSKGINNIVTSVVIIAIALSAIAILFPIILDAIRGPLLSPQVKCSEIVFGRAAEIESACYDAEKSTYNIKIKRPLSSVEIDSLTFLISNGEKSKRWQCSNSCGNCVLQKPGGTKFYHIYSNEPMQNAELSLYAGECIMGREEVMPC